MHDAMGEEGSIEMDLESLMHAEGKEEKGRLIRVGMELPNSE
jgi:hypothetical protein